MHVTQFPYSKYYYVHFLLYLVLLYFIFCVQYKKLHPVITFFLYIKTRYYRLWIYTCNAVLLMAVIVFCGVAGKVLLADYKRLLVTGLNLGQPSFIYAYLALLVQSGKFIFFFFLQTFLIKIFY